MAFVTVCVLLSLSLRVTCCFDVKAFKMVFYFTPCDPNYVIYMGKDKFENEELIKYGLPTDIWFHVDNLSSAHVYLRLPDGVTIDNIPPAVLEDCCQLTKENSIKGCKEPSVALVYTPWENLLKNETTMDIGQVGFKKDKAVKKITVTKKNPVINRLNRTKVEKYPNLQEIKYEYDARQARLLKEQKKQKQQAEKQKFLEKKEKEQHQKEMYSDLMDYGEMRSNKELAMTEEDYEESFM